MRAPTTPQSLKWLINRRARLAGEIAKLDKIESDRITLDKARIDDLTEKLAQAGRSMEFYSGVNATLRKALLDEMAAVDLLMGQHRIKVNPEFIGSIKTRDKVPVGKHGTMIGDILAYLRLANGVPATYTQIAAHIAHSRGIEYSSSAFPDFRKRVQKGLDNLSTKGRVKEVGGPRGRLEGRYILVEMPMTK